MSLWFAALMGLVQGLTEFLPISSTAHLRILPALFKQPDLGAAYTAVLQLGTLLAVLIYFAKDLVNLPVAMFRAPSSADGKMPWLLAVGTVPIVIAGVVLKKHIEGDLRSLYVIVGTLVGVGIVMIVIDRYVSGRASTRPLIDITFTDAIIIGLAQTLALVPGVSRSGATICMALLLGFSRSDSARFSFLLSIPAVAGAGIWELRSVLAAPIVGVSWQGLVVGTSVAAVSGYVSIAWLIKWLGSHDLLGFAIYRIIAGLTLLALLARGIISAM